MSRIVPVVSSNVDAKVAATLSQVKASLRMVPNLFATLAHAPVVLDGYLSLSKMLSRGRVSVAQREIVALAVGQENEISTLPLGAYGHGQGCRCERG